MSGETLELLRVLHGAQRWPIEPIELLHQAPPTSGTSSQEALGSFTMHRLWPDAVRCNFAIGAHGD